MDIDQHDIKKTILIIAKDPTLLPERKTIWSVCLDLCVSEDAVVDPGKITIVSAGIKTVIPHWRHSKVYARSWLPTKQWVTLANAVAIIDSDYRWEYRLQLRNISDQVVKLSKWTRVCQIEFCPTYIPENQTIWDGIVPDLKLICDADLYDNCNKIFPTDRWIWWLHSTGK